MTVTIESIVMDGIVIDEQFDLMIDAETQTANDGSLIVYEAERKFSILNLVGGENWGWVSRGDLLALQNLARVMGATYTLDYEGEIYTVRFRTEDIPTVYGEPVMQRPDKESTDWYKNISIKLMEV